MSASRARRLVALASSESLVGTREPTQRAQGAQRTQRAGKPANLTELPYWTWDNCARTQSLLYASRFGFGFRGLLSTIQVRNFGVADAQGWNSGPRLLVTQIGRLHKVISVVRVLRKPRLWYATCSLVSNVLVCLWVCACWPLACKQQRELSHNMVSYIVGSERSVLLLAGCRLVQQPAPVN